MKKEKKNILPKAALGAFAAALTVFCILLNVEKNVLTEYEKGTVYVAETEVPQGTVFDGENTDQYISEAQVDKAMIPEKAIKDPEELNQLMAVQHLDKGMILTGSMFEDTDEITEKMKEPVIAAFKADDLYQVVSGTLRDGDRIHIYTVDSESGSAYLVWDDIYVREVFDSTGGRIVPSDKLTAAHRINILMERENVEQFYSELSAGSLRVVKAVR